MLDQILIVVSVTFLVMITPGPDMILVLRNTFASGRAAGLQTAIGILSGNLVHITYCVLGIGLLISRSILAFSVLKYAAAGYLIYLGIVSVRSGLSRRVYDGHYSRHVDQRHASPHPQHDARECVFLAAFYLTLDRPIIRGAIERSQQAVNRIFGTLLGIRLAAITR